MQDGTALLRSAHLHGHRRVALFLGRIVYRFVQVYSAGGFSGCAAGYPGRPADPSTMVRSPLTAGIFFVLIGYYVCYYGLVLWKSKHMTARISRRCRRPGAMSGTGDSLPARYAGGNDPNARVI